MKVTIGSDFKMYGLHINNSLINLQIWDFAGEERFRFLLPGYCNGALGILLCYDITRYATFKHIQKWYDLTKKNTHTNKTVFILVGEKKDLEYKRSISEEEGKKLRKELDLDHFFETSSKSGENNKLIFKTLGKKICDNLEIEL
jgi:small GTP-binding protein